MLGDQNTDIVDAFRKFFKSNSILAKLILINFSVFVLIYIVSLFAWLFVVENGNNQTGLSILGQWLAVPSSIDRLLLKPWTIFTYMFVHEGLLHLLFNMMVLYFGGTVFLQYLSQKQLLWTYLAGGLSGAVVFIVSFNVFPVFSQTIGLSVAIGASASVLAIVVGISTYVPHYKVNLLLIGPVKLKYLAIAYIILDFFSIMGNNPGGHLAHLGGALWGFAYVSMLKNNIDIFGFSNRSGSFRMKTSHRAKPGGRPLNDDEYNRNRVAEQKEIDRILDQIAQSGYNTLTSRDKELLFRTSNKKK
ncbi:MAG: rhomboid family intramembrane serine protease [Bacteroidales bacterium]|nr:rhomboid family intramembrane serine protease [Bacteroidales bacterium]